MTANDDTPAPQGEFSIKRAMQAIRSGDWGEAEYERKLSESFKHKGGTSPVWGPFFINYPKGHPKLKEGSR